MKIEQIYTPCLAQGAYYIESEGEAAIVDPLRESRPYLNKAAKEKVKIKYIFETHFHADFVSGHVDLALKTGATIIFGPGAKTAYDIYEAKDEEIFNLGDIKIKVLHTPGHTMESSTYLVFDEDGKEHAIFSGDTLFIGGVGRPDLVQKGNITQNDLAGYLFDSLREKVMTLPDDIIVYPAHGAGSACGKNLSKETKDILGNQKKTNYALRADMTKEEFIHEVTDGMLPPPQYFARNVAMNKSAVMGVDEVLERGNVPLDVETFEAMANNEEALILDCRKPGDFALGHIPNAVFIGIDGGFAPWVGTLIPQRQQPLIFIADNGREEEVGTRLSRVGFDNTLGYLKGAFDTWRKAGKAIEVVKSITAFEFADIYEREELNVLDVRKQSEYEVRHVENAQNFPLSYIRENTGRITREKQYYIHCASGYRSMIAASILKSEGFHHLINVAGGFKAIVETGTPTVSETEPK